MVVWNSMLVKNAIILLAVVKQHVRFIVQMLGFSFLQEIPAVGLATPLRP